ncbi:MAG: XdhC family protein [Bacilli bacterium]
MNNLFTIINEYLEKNEPIVLVSVLSKTKGAPATPGQLMLVDANGIVAGTIGGGVFEYTIIKQSQEAIINQQVIFEYEYELEDIGMICGGSVKGVGQVFGLTNPIIIFGGGHVAQALVKVLKPLNMPITVVDDRAGLIEDDSINYLTKQPADVEDYYFNNKPFVVITTRGANLDYLSLKKALGYDCAYIGMIGSKTKVSEIFAKLGEEGHTSEQLKQVYAPIGIDIASGLPSEIAISIAAQILLVKNKGELKNKNIL